uniref:J domain-containing protein n=1 Tax=Macrostomum lignano TaxID=282301 RepID=A0A1I8FDH4_9PLAT
MASAHNCLHSAVHPRPARRARQFYLGRSLPRLRDAVQPWRLLRRLAARPVQPGALHRESEDQFLSEEYQADLSRFTSVQQILQSAPAPGPTGDAGPRPLRDDYEALKRRLAGSIFFRDKLRDKAPRCSWSRYFGVYLVGNIGVHQMSFTKLAICSYCSFVVYSTDFNNILYGSLLTVSLANWFCRDWRSRPAKPKSRCGPAPARLLNNARVTYEGESVPLREAMRDTVGKLYEYYKIHGFKEILKQLWDALDPQGLKDAASRARRPRTRFGPAAKLKVELHPDRQQDPDKKAEFQAKFQDVSAACDILLVGSGPAGR